MIYKTVVRPLLFCADPEWAHEATIRLAECVGRSQRLLRAVERCYQIRDPRLRTSVAGIGMDNPVGLAAGFDKSGCAVALSGRLGFGHVEIGSISAFPSAGNPRPRLWRLPRDRAVCVHYGLPNDGAEAVATRLEKATATVPLGINLVNTNRGSETPASTEDEVLDDYARSAQRLASFASYWMINLSCPNTEDGRGFFETPRRLAGLLSRLEMIAPRRPLFLKISPDWSDRQTDSFLEIVSRFESVAGFMFNLSASRRDSLVTPPSVWQGYPGAISGPPNREWMKRKVADLYRRTDPGRHKIVAAGGISDAQQAYDMIRSGASLVQLYTVLIYQGPGIVKRINRGLSQLIRRDGFIGVGEAVGVDANRTAGA